jgi:hypothetical protein
VKHEAPHSIFVSAGQSLARNRGFLLFFNLPLLRSSYSCFKRMQRDSHLFLSFFLNIEKYNPLYIVISLNPVTHARCPNERYTHTHTRTRTHKEHRTQFVDSSCCCDCCGCCCCFWLTLSDCLASCVNSFTPLTEEKYHQHNTTSASLFN